MKQQGYKSSFSEDYSISSTKSNVEKINTFQSPFLFFQKLFTELVISISPQPQTKVVIVGGNHIAYQLKSFFLNHKLKEYQFEGVFNSSSEDTPFRIEGNLEQLKTLCLTQKIDRIYCTLPPNSTEMKDLEKFADQNFISFRYAGSSLEEKPTAYYYDAVPIIPLREEPLASQTS